MSSLKKPWLMVAAAALAVLAVGVVTFRDLFRDVLLECKSGVVVHSIDGDDGLLAPLESIPFGDKSGFIITYDRVTPDKKLFGVNHYEGVRITSTQCETSHEASCACADVPIPWVDKTLRATPSDVRLYRHGPTGDYVVRARTWTMSHEETIAIFRRTATPMRRFLPARALSTRHVPALVVWLALGALAVAAARARRATFYSETMSAWRPATLSADGMLQDESGTTVGVLASGRKRVPQGSVLVAPSALGQGSIYRELPVVSRSDVAAGTHQRWIEATALRLRDARSLAILATLSALFGLGARFLGA